MPAQKRPKTTSTGGPVMVILEEIRSQNRATIETVEARHEETRRDLQDFRTEVRGDVQMVQGAVQAQRDDIRLLRAELGTLEEHLSRLDRPRSSGVDRQLGRSWAEAH